MFSRDNSAGGGGCQLVENAKRVGPRWLCLGREEIVGTLYFSLKNPVIAVLPIHFIVVRNALTVYLLSVSLEFSRRQFSFP